MSTKPTTLPIWNTALTNNVTPSGAKQAAGFSVSEAPSSSYQNWWQNLVYQWSQYLSDAVFTTSVTNGTCFTATGNGTGAGVSGTGGASNGKGVVGQGSGTGTGVQGTGGSTGAGITGVGGATSGNGGDFSATAGNSKGVTGAGQGSGDGVTGTGGATGVGVRGNGGSTSGNGVQGTGGPGGGHGGAFTATGGNSNGVFAQGNGSGAGVNSTGGPNGVGVRGVGGSSSGGYGGSFGGGGASSGALHLDTQAAAPTGTSALGDCYVDSVGSLWMCTTAGSPGTFSRVGPKGTATNDNANAGAIGEFVESLAADGSVGSWTTNVSKNITSISLTAGDWDVEGVVSFAAASITGTNCLGGMSTTTATNGPVPSEMPTVPTTSGSVRLALTRQRFSLSSTSTVFLVGRIVFSAGTPTAGGYISARRVR
jgi:hypothetical protein